MTLLVRLDPESPDEEAIKRAAAIIRSGGLVAFPTETVYGLGADATNEAAVQKVFEAKGRPADNPLIVHVCSPEMLDIVARRVSERAQLLEKEFWPGPLTLVLERNPSVAPSVSAGLNTVAVRMPRCAIALDLIRCAERPIAAPSANVSGRPSPTTAAHVLGDLEGQIDMILDGGATNIGVESTVLDLTEDPPVILRPGWITREQLAETIGPVEAATSNEDLKRSPGTRHRHYSPRTRLILIEHASARFLAEIVERHLKSGRVGFIGHSRVDLPGSKLIRVTLENDASQYARSLYSALRELDEQNVSVIVVEGIDDRGEGEAVMDRLRRAASEIISGIRNGD